MAIRGYAWSACFAAFSALFSALFAYTACVLARYTPVYQPIRCVSLGSKMGDMDFDENFVNMTGQSVKFCTNPNPYPMTLSQASPKGAGGVFVLQGAERKAVGVVHVPEAYFAAGGSNNLTALMLISVPALDAAEILLASTLAVAAEFHVTAEAEPEYFGQAIRIGEEQFQACGFEVNMDTFEVGTAVCALSMDELVIPAFNQSVSGEDYLDMTAESRAEKSKEKNLTFAALLVVQFILAVAFGACAAASLRRRWKGAARGDAQEPKIEGAAPRPAEALPAGAEGTQVPEGCRKEAGSTRVPAEAGSAAADAAEVVTAVEVLQDKHADVWSAQV